MWLIDTISTLIRLAPRKYALIVSLKVTSQLSKILAFVLPLKALLVAGAGVLPSYLNWPIFGGQPSAAVLLMSAVAVFAYYAHLKFEKYASHLVAELAERIPVAPGLMVLSAAQIQKKSLFASKLIDICVASVMMVLMWLALPLLQWQIGLSYWLVCLVVICVLAVYWRFSSSFRDRIEAGLVARVNQLSSLLFFAGFGLLLTVLLNGITQGILIAVISMVMIRVFAAQLVVIVSRADGLVRNRILVDKLISGQLDPVVDARYRPASVEQIIAQELSDDRQIQILKWMPSTSANLGVLLCEVHSSEGIKHCLLKIYHEGRVSDSRWEEMLSDRHAGRGLGLYQTSHGSSANGVWRLLEVPRFDAIVAVRNLAVMQAFCAQKMTIEPDQELVSIHDEKFGSLVARLSLASPRKLLLAHMSDSRLMHLDVQWPLIIERLRSLPLQYLLKYSRDSVVENKEKSLIHHLFCENWRVAHVGAELDGSFARIDWGAVLVHARMGRPALNRVSVLDLELSRVLSRYESAMSQRRWGLAWAELEAIDVAWQALQQ